MDKSALMLHIHAIYFFSSITDINEANGCGVRSNFHSTYLIHMIYKYHGNG